MGKIKAFLQKSKVNTLLIVCIFSVLFYGLIIKRNGIVYIMNDDIAMRAIVSGIYLGEPSMNMIFSSVPFSSLLFVLYRITDKLDWYGLVLILSNMFFLSYTIYSIVKMKNNIFEKIVYTIVLFFIVSVLFSGFLVEITFTTTAAFIAICCLILFMLPNSKLKNFIIMLGIILSFGIRTKACAMILVFFVPALFYKNMKNKENLKKDFFFGLKIAIILLFCVVVDKAMMNEINWKQYLEYNNYRSLYYDYYAKGLRLFPEEEKRDIFYEAGFEDDEITMLTSGDGGIAFYKDIPSKMSTLIEKCEEHGLKQNLYIKGYISYLFKTKMNSYYVFSLIIMCYFLMITSDRKRKSLRVLPFVVLQWIILLYLAIQGRVPDRVIVPLYFGYIVMNLCITLKEEEPSKIIKNILNYNKKITTIFLVIFFIVSIQNVEIHNYNSDYLEQDNKIFEYFEENSENFYIFDRNSTEKFSIFNKYSAKNYINKSGWTVFSPLHTKKIKEQGVESLKELLLKENVYLVLESDNADKYKSIYANAKIEKVEEVNDLYIYKFTK